MKLLLCSFLRPAHVCPQIVSSGFDRTLESAAALALALFPPGQDDEDVGTATMLNNNHIIVPVHAADPQNDSTLFGVAPHPDFARVSEHVLQEKARLCASEIPD